MRYLRLWICGLLILPVMGGCTSFVQSERNKAGVTVEEGGKFPEFLAGRWKSNKDGWQIVFEKDGTISSIVHTLGRVRIKAGQATTVPMKKGGKGVFEPGKWTVNYVPSSRELTVSIALKKAYIEVGDNILKCKSTDVFTGKVSEDGKTWDVAWMSFPDYTARSSKQPEARIAPTYGLSHSLAFEKVAEK